MDAPALLKREGLECPLIAYTDVDRSWLLAAWHEVSQKPFSYH
jgi:hypothetical protein